MREADSAAVALHDAGLGGRGDVVGSTLGNRTLEQLEGRLGAPRPLAAVSPGRSPAAARGGRARAPVPPAAQATARPARPRDPCLGAHARARARETDSHADGSRARGAGPAGGAETSRRDLGRARRPRRPTSGRPGRTSRSRAQCLRELGRVPPARVRDVPSRARRRAPARDGVRRRRLRRRRRESSHWRCVDGDDDRTFARERAEGTEERRRDGAPGRAGRRRPPRAGARFRGHGVAAAAAPVARSPRTSSRRSLRPLNESCTSAPPGRVESTR